MAVNFVFRLIMTALLWRSLDEAGIIIYAVVNILSATTFAVSELGLSTALARFVERSQDVFKTSLKIFAIGIPLIAAPAVLLMAQILKWEGNSHLLALAFVSGVSIAFFQICGTYPRATNRVKSFTVWSLLRSSLHLLGVVYLYYTSQLTLLSWFYVSVMTHTLGSLGLMGFIRLVWDKLPKPAVKNENRPEAPGLTIPELMGFCLPVWLAALFQFTDNFVDIAFLKSSNQGDIPAYRLGIEYGLMITSFSLLVNKSWPVIAYRVLSGREEQGLTEKEWWLPIAGLCLYGLVLTMFLPLGVRAISGSPASIESLWICLAVLWASTIASWIPIIRPVMEFKKKTSAIFLSLGIGFALNILGNFFFTPIYGGMGAALSSAAAWYVSFWILSVRAGLGLKAGSIILVFQLLFLGFSWTWARIMWSSVIL